jgi:hypothetical protein
MHRLLCGFIHRPWEHPQKLAGRLTLPGDFFGDTARVRRIPALNSSSARSLRAACPLKASCDGGLQRILPSCRNSYGVASESQAYLAICGNVEDNLGKLCTVSAGMNDLPYLCPTCKTIYEVIRHRVRPTADPVCEACQQDFPVAENGDWLTYRLTPPRVKRTG